MKLTFLAIAVIILILGVIINGNDANEAYLEQKDGCEYQMYIENTEQNIYKHLFSEIFRFLQEMFR